VGAAQPCGSLHHGAAAEAEEEGREEAPDDAGDAEVDEVAAAAASVEKIRTKRTMMHGMWNVFPMAWHLASDWQGCFPRPRLAV